MAFCDYHNCDCCGNSKTFYDADIWGESAVDAGYPSGIRGAADLKCICDDCAKTHMVVIVERPTAPTTGPTA